MHQKLSIVAIALLMMQCFIFSGTAYLVFDETLHSGLQLQPSSQRVNCVISTQDAFNGTHSIKMNVPTGTVAGDYCGIFTEAGHTLDLSKYSELEYFLKAGPTDKQFGKFHMEDVHHVVAGNQGDIWPYWTRYKFPLPATFSGLSITEIIAPVLLELQMTSTEFLFLDLVRLRSLDHFDIFTKDTTYGREILKNWGTGTCKVTEKTGTNGAITQRTLTVPSGLWGCGLFFIDPTYDLTNWQYLEFRLISNVEVKIEVESASGKTAVYVPSTGGVRTLIRLPLSSFNLNLHSTNAPFMITKNGGTAVTSVVIVDNVRYTH